MSKLGRPNARAICLLPFFGEHNGHASISLLWSLVFNRMIIAARKSRSSIVTFVGSVLSMPVPKVCVVMGHNSWV